MTDSTLHSFKVLDINKNEFDLATLAGKHVLVVNVASKCGFTPQYTGLQKLYEKYQTKGLEIIGFPCNQFGGQEPGNNSDISEFCSRTYSVSFPIMDKVEVNGKNEAPVYSFLKQTKGFLGMKRIKWNFEKFLVGPDGKVINRYSSLATPESLDSEIAKQLEKQQPKS